MHCLHDIFRTLSASENILYCEFQDDVGFVEMYDLTADPYQLLNLAQQMDPGTRARYSEKLHNLESCRGRGQCFQPE